MSESTSPPLARALLERDGASRTLADRAAQFDADPTSLVLLLRGTKALLSERVEDVAPALDLRSPIEVRAVLGGAERVTLRCYLGRLVTGVDEAPGHASVEDRHAASDLDPGSLPASAAPPVEVWVLDDEAADAIEPEPARWIGLRQAATQLEVYEAGLLAQAVAIANWHAASRFCPRCGGPTELAEAGWSRRCTVDGGSIFPRTDPAVIVLVTDAEDRVLLGSNAMWESNRFSLLAGYVEPGESLEHAVVREIGEEAGLPVGDVQYAGSQPWPFPASLMLGFTARAVATAPSPKVTPDGVEILELRWFTREELAAALPEIGFPGRTSIAGWLLERWFGAPIESSPRGWGA
ncbi:NAD(+) diphosphatase [Agromyces salentinus]|uniref:NAD(+) diphosphatase n=1 Tax=Agromyces salentinus TaxID=269421 RepID=A0ABN2MP37_9MICO|nr:NAD(+) diphosphatase [Agromyces salentinus]